VVGNAYEAAVEEARRALASAKDFAERAKQVRLSAEDQVNKIEADLREAAEAEAKVARIEPALPAAVAELSRLDSDCTRLTGKLGVLASTLTDMKVQEALYRRSAEDIQGKLERVRSLADSSELRQELAGLREREAAARRDADASYESPAGWIRQGRLQKAGNRNLSSESAGKG
jgi:chromosome segregation ATPase